MENTVTTRDQTKEEVLARLKDTFRTNPSYFNEMMDKARQRITSRSTRSGKLSAWDVLSLTEFGFPFHLLLPEGDSLEYSPFIGEKQIPVQKVDEIFEQFRAFIME